MSDYFLSFVTKQCSYFSLGRSYAVYSQKMLNAAIESLVQKVQCGVVINFEKFGPDPPDSKIDGNESNAKGKSAMNYKGKKKTVITVKIDNESGNTFLINICKDYRNFLMIFTLSPN